MIHSFIIDLSNSNYQTKSYRNINYVNAIYNCNKCVIIKNANCNWCRHIGTNANWYRYFLNILIFPIYDQYLHSYFKHLNSTYSDFRMSKILHAITLYLVYHQHASTVYTGILDLTEHCRKGIFQGCVKISTACLLFNIFVLYVRPSWQVTVLPQVRSIHFYAILNFKTNKRSLACIAS